MPAAPLPPFSPSPQDMVQGSNLQHLTTLAHRSTGRPRPRYVAFSRGPGLPGSLARCRPCLAVRRLATGDGRPPTFCGSCVEALEHGSGLRGKGQIGPTLRRRRRAAESQESGDQETRGPQRRFRTRPVGGWGLARVGHLVRPLSQEPTPRPRPPCRAQSPPSAVSHGILSPMSAFGEIPRTAPRTGLAFGPLRLLRPRAPRARALSAGRGPRFPPARRDGSFAVCFFPDPGGCRH